MVMTDSFGSVLLHCIFSRGQGSLVGPLTHQLCRWNLRPNITTEHTLRRGYSSPASCACSVVIRYFRRNVSNPFFQSVPSTDAVIMGFPIVPLIHTTIAFASAGQYMHGVTLRWWISWEVRNSSIFFDTKFGPLSELTCSGRPYVAKNSMKRRIVTSVDRINLNSGQREQASTKTKMHSLVWYRPQRSRWMG